jgi:predicted ATPase
LDPLLFLIAHSLLAVPSVSRGEFTTARAHFEEGISLYDAQQHRFLASVYGDDPGITCLSLRALSLWFLGYPDQALQSAQGGLALARDLDLPYNVSFALDITAWIHCYRGEPQNVQACLASLFPLVNEQGFEFFAAESQILQGWMLAEQSQHVEGLIQMRAGLADYCATGAEMSRPSHLSLLAKTYGKAEQTANALETLTAAFAVVNKTGEHCLDAELYRIKGELLLQQISDQSPKSRGKKERPSKIRERKTRT